MGFLKMIEFRINPNLISYLALVNKMIFAKSCNSEHHFYHF